ncbi:hypothetical protein ACOMD4_03395 [Streptomyces anulatus]|uniref:hypothetical protein n=1 Tax=Streptomyces anulatus TaxID=1892 RepID=UPI003B80E650
MKRNDRIRLGVRASTGQTAIEYLALLAVVLAVVGAIVATGIGGSLSRSAQEQVCRIGPAGFVGVDCSDDNDVETVRAAEPDASDSAAPVDDGAGEPFGAMLDEPVRTTSSRCTPSRSRTGSRSLTPSCTRAGTG